MFFIVEIVNKAVIVQPDGRYLMYATFNQAEEAAGELAKANLGTFEVKERWSEVRAGLWLWRILDGFVLEAAPYAPHVWQPLHHPA